MGERVAGSGGIGAMAGDRLEGEVEESVGAARLDAAREQRRREAVIAFHVEEDEAAAAGDVVPGEELQRFRLAGAGGARDEQVLAAVVLRERVSAPAIVEAEEEQLGRAPGDALPPLPAPPSTRAPPTERDPEQQIQADHGGGDRAEEEGADAV